MKVKQLSTFIENKTGRLLEVTKHLQDSNINIRALSLADTADFGILRLIVNDVDTAFNVLKKNNFTAIITEVIAVEVSDRPGGLHNILALFAEKGLNVEYMYAFVETKTQEAIVIFRIEDLESAIQTLSDAGVKILTGEEVCGL